MKDVFDDIASLEIKDVGLVQINPAMGSKVSLRKPRNNEFFRVSISPMHNPTPMSLYTDDSDGKTYIVVPKMAEILGSSIAKPRLLYVAINRNEEVFISPVGIGDDTWSVSSRKAHQAAMKDWVRIASNRATKNYTQTIAQFSNSPVFPQATWSELLREAIGTENVIDAESHPVFNELMGRETTPTPPKETMEERTDRIRKNHGAAALFGNQRLG